MENQPIARLTFTCNRNWEEMVPVAGGRFCNDCQKKVIDFTGKTNDEIAAYLIESTTQVCGRFQQSQLVPAPLKPILKRWLSAAAMFVAVFIGVKEASAQEVVQKDTVSKNAGRITSFGVAEKLPEFPGGENAFGAFLHNNLHPPKGVQGRLIVSFLVKKDGSLADRHQSFAQFGQRSRRGSDKSIEKKSEMEPGLQAGNVVETAYTMPINF